MGERNTIKDRALVGGKEEEGKGGKEKEGK